MFLGVYVNTAKFGNLRSSTKCNTREIAIVLMTTKFDTREKFVNLFNFDFFLRNFYFQVYDAQYRNSSWKNQNVSIREEILGEETIVLDIFAEFIFEVDDLKINAVYYVKPCDFQRKQKKWTLLGEIYSAKYNVF